tara:strand:- start:138 stop:353 length:216 start_codon:yes stop_codon:yes gene_type:complete
MTSKKKSDSIYQYSCKNILNSRSFNPFVRRVKPNLVSLPKLPDNFIVKKEDEKKLIDIYSEDYNLESKVKK